MSILTSICNLEVFHERPSIARRIGLAVNAWFWVVVSFAWFAWLTTESTLPGVCAEAATVFSGLQDNASKAYPILRTLCESLRMWFPEVDRILLLNLLSAGIAALTIGAAFGTLQFWIEDAMEEEAAVIKRRLYSQVVANLFSFCLCVFAPWLYAATTFTPGLWALFMIVLLVRWQTAYAGSGQAWRMALFGFAMGVFGVESEFVLAVAPILFIRIVQIEWRLWDRNTRHLAIWFICLILGVAVAMYYNAVRSFPGEALTFTQIVDVQIDVLRAQLKSLWGVFPSRWILVLLLGPFWGLLSWFIGMRAIDNGRKWSHVMAMILLSGIGICIVCFVPYTFWPLWVEDMDIPTTSAFVVILGFVALVGGWWGYLFLPNPERFAEADGEDFKTAVLVSRAMAWVFVPVMIATIVTSAVLSITSYCRVDRRLADRYAEETLKRLNGRPFFLGASWLDPLLTIAAYRKGEDFVPFCLYRITDTVYLKELQERLETSPLLQTSDRVRMRHLMEHDFYTFVQDFYLAQDNATQIAAVLSLADTWYAARRVPLPECIFFGGVQDLAAGAKYDLYPEHRKFWDEWSDVLTDDSESWWDFVYPMRRAIRRQTALVANNLGVFLDDTGRSMQSVEAYAFAHQIYPDNISALLNLYDVVVRRKLSPEREVAVRVDFEDFISKKDRRGKYDLAQIGRTCGYIRNYELFAQMGWKWALSASPESTLAGLRAAQIEGGLTARGSSDVETLMGLIHEMRGAHEASEEGFRKAIVANPRNIVAVQGLARMAIQRGAFDEAEEWLEGGEAAGVETTDLDLDWATYYLALGDLEKARISIDRYIGHNLEAPTGWAMLGLIELEENNVERVKTYILDRLGRIAKGPDVYYVHLLSARIAQTEAQELMGDEAREKLKGALAHYRKALDLRPTMQGLQDAILILDIKLGDAKMAEIDALAILRDRPNHSNANYVIGSQRLREGLVDIALTYLRKAAAVEEPPAILLNNYAEALARSGNLAEAHKIAVRVTEVAPQFYASWATLASILAWQGDNDQAQINIDKAKAMEGGDDPRLLFTDAWIAKNKKDTAKRDAILAQIISALGEDLSPLDQQEIRSLRE